MSVASVAPSIEVLRSAIDSWWVSHREERDRLPWRKTRDPWHVFVSETMLAQTQVARVATRYEDVIARFPTPSACAAAPRGEVLRAWVGLGYNRRAANLHAAAEQMVELHGGFVPRTLEELLALPGVGPYTARAVMAFAFESDVAVVDTNIRRVIARAYLGKPARPSELQSRADALVCRGRARDWNLALMDFGSVVCSSRSPKCDGCPLAMRGACAWRSAPDSEDPAVAQARAIGRQKRFVGSDREGRGRLIKAACEGPIVRDELARIAGWSDDPARAQRVAEALCLEGLLLEEPTGYLRLP